MHISSEELQREILILNQFGKIAMGALKDAKPVVGQILEYRGLEFTANELNSIYSGLKDLSYDCTINQFDAAIDTQTAKIKAARNRMVLLSKWETLTGESSVKNWCVTHQAPIGWIIPKECSKAIAVLIDVQQGVNTTDPLYHIIII